MESSDDQPTKQGKMGGHRMTSLQKQGKMGGHRMTSLQIRLAGDFGLPQCWGVLPKLHRKPHTMEEMRAGNPSMDEIV